MSDEVTRRGFLSGAAAASLAPLVAAATPADASTFERSAHHAQPGIVTAAQDYLCFAAFDVVGSRGELEELLKRWTDASGRLMVGRPVGVVRHRADPPPDTGEAIGLGAAGLTVTFGVGPTLFDHRFALQAHRPEALAALPSFPGDAIDPSMSGGDLCLQACANDPQVAFGAIHNLARLAQGVATVRYLQNGFGRTSSTTTTQSTPRNLLGFKDGTNNLTSDDTEMLRRHVWVGAEGPTWMNGGTYLVARRLRTHLELWSSLPLSVQESIIGRFRESGAPLSGHHEHDPVRLNATGFRGGSIIPLDAHIRVAAHSENAGAKILRRGYSFSDGIDPMTGELDAGLFFISFQRDAHQQFVRIQENLAHHDALRHYITATSSSLFACPPRAGRGGFWGDQLLGA